MSGRFYGIGLALLGLGPWGCLGKPEEDAKSEQEKKEKECGRCHQSPFNPESGFKPLLGREDDRSAKLKRFMDRHTIGSKRLTHPLLCEDCHTVPKKVTAPGHINSDSTRGAEVVFPKGGRAAARGVTPEYDLETKTCAVACHGTGLKLGGVDRSPPWDQVPENPSNCAEGICHSIPPLPSHWQNLKTTDCHLCHSDTVRPNGTIADINEHINGVVKAPAKTEVCLQCHDQPPGRSPLGTPEERRDHIGAHQTHLVDQPLSTNVTCDNCHEVPTPENNLTGHLDADRSRAEVKFSALAIAAEGTPPSFDPEQMICSGVYCHGATLGGGKMKEPRWNDTDSIAKECDSCHGAPPPLPHIQPQHALSHRAEQSALACFQCHDKTAGPNQTIADKTTHVNGVIDVKEDICEVCHGQPPSNPEHPNHPDREDCWNCHPSVGEPEEIGQRPVILDPALHNNGTIDLFDNPEVICVQCHGTSGNDNPAPPNDTRGNFNRDSRGIGAHQQHLHSQKTGNIECGSCHTVPEDIFSELHRNGTTDLKFGGAAVFQNVVTHYDRPTQTCNVYCHGETLSGGKLNEPVWTDLSGRPAECDSCHGAPPPLPHMQPLHKLRHREAEEKLDCSMCHDETAGPRQTIADPTTHLNGTIDVKEDICEACHGQPPAEPDHPNHPDRKDCWSCHPSVAQPENEEDRPVILEAASFEAAHNNGTVDFVPTSELCIKCHGTPEKGPAPLPDGHGNNENIELGIFHNKHLRNTAISADPRKITSNVTCESCHTVYETVFDEGHRDRLPTLVFSGVAVLRGQAPLYDSETQSCRDVYCHGATLSGLRPEPNWTEINEESTSCNTCHGFPPASHPPEWFLFYNTRDEACLNCHIDAWVNDEGSAIIHPDYKALHIDGTVQELEGF